MSTAIAVATFIVGAVLALAATVIDARTHRLPNRLVGPLGALGLIGLTAASVTEPWFRLPQLAIGAVAFAGPWLAVHLVSPASIGFGDVKFTAALGVYLAWFDPLAGLWACAFALLLAWPHSVVHILRKTGATVPLGPYLLLGAVASVVFVRAS